MAYVRTHSDDGSAGARVGGGGGCCCCWSGLAKVLKFPGTSDDSRRDDFESTVKFLESVPLFRKQLPRAELPKIARSLKRKEWLPRQELVRQNETGRALFLIQSGEALVVTSPAPGEPGQTRATLGPGDYFGGHTLMTERPNIATIVASGHLVTLSMSRNAFEASGIRKWLHFPKRPALYGTEQTPGAHVYASSSSCFAEKTPEEEAFISKAVRKNVNLRALLSGKENKLQGIAAKAERREIKQGTDLAKCGEVGDEFFIVCQGSFDVILEDCQAFSGPQSAEAAVASSTMAERLLRKQHFLQALWQPSQKVGRGSRATSTYAGSGGVNSLSPGGEVPALARQ
ncbi:unnamed protein product, partial [Polarella glacialis]